MAGERLDQLELGPMVLHNTANLGTAFTVSIDAVEGCKTGISSYDRAQTVLAAVDPRTRSEDSRALVTCFLCAPGPTAFSKDAAKQKRLLISHDCRAASRRSDLRNHESRWQHGARFRSGKVLLRVWLHDGDCSSTRSLQARNRIRPTSRPASIRDIWARFGLGEMFEEMRCTQIHVLETEMSDIVAERSETS